MPWPRAGRSPSPSDPTLVLASANPKKAREMVELLAGIPYRILSLTDFPGVTLPPEGADSYAENASAKARTVAAATGLLALADDSGLEVDALGGRPGVLSARYGGEGLTDAQRCDKLLEALAGVPPLERTARFRSVIALVAPVGVGEIQAVAVRTSRLDEHDACAVRRPAHSLSRLQEPPGRPAKGRRHDIDRVPHGGFPGGARNEGQFGAVGGDVYSADPRLRLDLEIQVRRQVDGVASGD